MVLCQPIQIEWLTEQVSQIFLQPIQWFPYGAGHYVNVHCEGWHAPLSIACAPRADNLLEFHLSHPLRNVKAQKLLQLALQEQSWLIEGPLGHCTFRELPLHRPILFLAYETGIAPIKAVMETLMTLPTRPPIFLYWMVPQLSGLYLTSLLEEWSAHSNVAYRSLIVPERNFSSNDWSWPILQDHADFSNYQVYASGPRTLMQAACSLFVSQGLKREYFYSDVM